jgi:peptide chain release factor subunit 1
MEEVELFKLKRLISELEGVKGRHTELISLYIPSGADLYKVLDMLSQEAALAQRVKDKTVRKNVRAALEKIITYLRLFKQVPPNGLAIFCGNVSPEVGRADIRLWCIEPPIPTRTKLYRCDQVFVLTPLKELMKVEELFGLIVLDAEQATLGLLRSKSIEVFKRMDSLVPRKVIKGGMSARRYERIREEAIHSFFKKVGETATKLFLPLELKGILIGGPGPLKEQFAKGGYLHYKLRDLVLGVRSIGYTGDYGLRELVGRSRDLLERASIARELKLMDRFFLELQKAGPVVYGFEEVKRALEMGAIETLLISEGFDLVSASLVCERCGKRVKRFMPRTELERQRCKCGGELRAERVEEILDELLKKAEKFKTGVELISTTTGVGAQFKELGGIGGFLRFRPA